MNSFTLEMPSDTKDVPCKPPNSPNLQRIAANTLQLLFKKHADDDGGDDDLVNLQDSLAMTPPDNCDKNCITGSVSTDWYRRSLFHKTIFWALPEKYERNDESTTDMSKDYIGLSIERKPPRYHKLLGGKNLQAQPEGCMAQGATDFK